MAVLRTLHLSYPQIPKVVLMAAEGRELTVQSFRLGARGLFCLADSSFQRLCECIQQVHRGEIWATGSQTAWNSCCMQCITARCSRAPV